jgi:hypothetical protein
VEFTCTVIGWCMAFGGAFIVTVEQDICLKLVHVGRETILKKSSFV